MVRVFEVKAWLAIFKGDLIHRTYNVRAMTVEGAAIKAAKQARRDFRSMRAKGVERVYSVVELETVRIIT